jgi:hypothetical protein
VEVLGLEVEGEDVGEKGVEGAADFLHSFGLDIGAVVEGSLLAGDEFGLRGHRISFQMIPEI